MTRALRIHNKEAIVSSINGIWETGNPRAKNKIRPFKITECLNVTYETIKPLEENIWEKLLVIGLSKDFFRHDTKSTGKKKQK